MCCDHYAKGIGSAGEFYSELREAQKQYSQSHNNRSPISLFNKFFGSNSSLHRGGRGEWSGGQIHPKANTSSRHQFLNSASWT